MPLFKIEKLPVKGESVPFRINITAEGLFWCEPTMLMAGALGIGKIEGENFNSVKSQLWDAVEKYNALNSSHTYSIKFRFHFSKRIKKQMPISLMDSVNLKKTEGVGNQGFYNDEIGIIIDWFPVVKTVLGETVIIKKMRVADEKDIEYVQRYGKLFKGDLHKPYSELLFFAHDRFHEFCGGEKYFEIPLTDDTYNFFENLEKALVNTMVALFKYLSVDTELLMSNIKTAMLNDGTKFLGL